MLERPATEEAEQRGVARPQHGRGGVEDGEPSPRITQAACRQSDGGPAAGDEATDDDELAASFAQLSFGPGDLPLPAGAVKEPLLRSFAEAPAEPVAEVVAEERAERGGRQDKRQRKVTTCRDDTGGDDGGLARDQRHNGVEQCESQEDEICPARRVGDEAGELVKHAGPRRRRGCAIPTPGPEAAPTPGSAGGRGAVAHAVHEQPGDAARLLL